MIGESKSHGGRWGRPRLRTIDSRNLLLIFALLVPPTARWGPQGGQGDVPGVGGLT